MTTHVPAGFRPGRLSSPETPLSATVHFTSPCDLATTSAYALMLDAERDADALVAAHVQAVSDMLAEIHLTIWNDRERDAL